MTRRIVDLTLPLHDGMPTYPLPWHPNFEVVQLARHGIERRETRRLTMGTHTGTHCDAPRHFVEGGRTIEELPLDVLVGPAVVLDLTDAEPGPLAPDVFERLLGDRRPERLLLRFDWSDRWGTFAYFEGHPHLSEEAAQLLVDRGVRLLGIDTPTPDDPLTGRDGRPDSPVHHILLGAGVVLVEYLTNLKELPSDEIELVVLPLKLVGGDGAPVRCVAFA
jgi:kynurenine formamidase